MTVAAQNTGTILIITLMVVFCGLAIYGNLVLKPRLRAQQAKQQRVREIRR